MHPNASDFHAWQQENIKRCAKNHQLASLAQSFYVSQAFQQYSYNWNWLGVPIIQLPTDLMVMQELIFKVKPTIIIETGIARGGSLLFYATMMQLLSKDRGKVIGIDRLVLPHARNAIQENSLSEIIRIVEGDSTDSEVVSICRDMLTSKDKVLVVLDSLHTYSHVTQEMSLWGSLVSPDSYMVIFDTTIGLLTDENFERYRDERYPSSEFTQDLNTLTAVEDFLANEAANWERDDFWTNKAMISNCFGGFLKRRSRKRDIPLTSRRNAA